jgi:hypothetical protein
MTAEHTTTNRDKMIQVRVPWSVIAAVRSATDRKMTTVSEYVRTAVLVKLRQDGFDPMEFTPPPHHNTEP